MKNPDYIWKKKKKKDMERWLLSCDVICFDTLIIIKKY